jgi:electron transfer DM13
VARHPVAMASGALLAAAFVAFVLVFFQPQKIFLTQRVDEAPPSVSDSPTSEHTGGTTTLVSGSFHGLEHDTSGRALILELPDGSRFLRFESFRTLNGPDLHVYLSPEPSGDDLHAYGRPGFIDLGKLKGNVGDQNYELAEGLDLSRFRSAVVWCKRFAVGFGVAPLES